jgi:hypothetical protein
MLSLLLFFSMSWASSTSESLAIEAEKVWQSLKPTDPLRQKMEPRLGDLYFDAATEIAGHEDVNAASERKLQQNRTKAQSFYRLAIADNPTASKKEKIRLQFQIARLDADLGNLPKAQVIWNSLAEQNEELEIQRESALRLAEIKEISAVPADLKMASHYYETAQKNCVKKTVCSYIQYRWAWVDYRLGQTDQGLERLLESLKIADASSQKEILKDLLVFLSHSSWSSEKALELIRQWKSAEVINEDMLLASYNSAGRRKEYRELLAVLVKERKGADDLIAALEYDDQNGELDKVSNSLSLLEAIKSSTGANLTKDSEQKLYRTLVSWDAQRKQKPAYKDLYLRGSEIFLTLFSTSSERQKVAEGRLVVMDKADDKLSWLTKRKKVSVQQKDVAFEKWARQRLWQLGIQEKRPELVLQESAYLAKASAKEEQRDYLYQEGRAWMAQNQLEKAKARFQELSNPSSNPADEIQLFSVNLLLGFSEQEKNYSQLVSQSQAWLENPKTAQNCKKDQKWTAECKQIGEIHKKATFELANLNQDRKSLDTFYAFCMKSEFLPLSCQNAKTLARKLKEQAIYLTLLRRENNETVLASELEYAGYFAEAAQRQEKLLQSQKADLKADLKIAFLYEISGDQKNQLKVLRRLVSEKKKGFANAEEEQLLWTILRLSPLPVDEYFSLNWAEARKAELASQLGSNKDAQKYLAERCGAFGPAWENIHLEQLKQTEAQLSKISIVGRNSERNFKKKNDLFAKLTEQTTCVLKGLSLENQQKVAAKMASLYSTFAKDIRAVPLPEGLDESTKAQVQAQIDEMAKPYEQSASKWTELKGSATVAAAWPEKQSLIAPKAMASSGLPSATVIQLQKQPDSPSLMKEVAQYYEKEGKPHLAAYFKDRAGDLQKENQ